MKQRLVEFFTLSKSSAIALFKINLIQELTKSSFNSRFQKKITVEICISHINQFLERQTTSFKCLLVEYVVCSQYVNVMMS